MKLLNMSIHLKITLPLWIAYGKSNTEGVWISHGIAKFTQIFLSHTKFFFNLAFNLSMCFLFHFYYQVRFGEPQHAESEEIFTAISEFVKSFKREADITLMAAGQTHLVRYVKSEKEKKNRR